MLAGSLILFLGVASLAVSQDTGGPMPPHTPTTRGTPKSHPGSSQTVFRQPTPASNGPQRSQGQKGPDTAPSLFPQGYLDHAKLTAAIQGAAASSSGRVRLRSLARTLEGRDIWLATLSHPEGSPSHSSAGTPSLAGKPPAILIVANLEADHLVGSQVALTLIQRMASDPGWAKQLPPCLVYVVPRLNPDGAERLIHKPQAEFRTNLQPLDRDRDGRSGEDGPDDLDGDGLIVRMRVKDTDATLVPDKRDSRLLRKADSAKGERPIYSEYTEGLDNDGDGLLNEDPPGGVNLNRNWPYHWAEFDPEAGFSPAAEAETRALIEFVFDHPEIAVVWSFSLHDNLIARLKNPAADLADADLPIYVELSDVYTKVLSSISVGSNGKVVKPLPREKDAKPDTQKTSSQEPEKPRAAAPPPGTGTRAPVIPETTGSTTDGALSEWAYHHFGVIGLSSRLWHGPKVPGATSDKDAKPGDGTAPESSSAPVPVDAEMRWLDWNDRVMGGRAFMPYKSFKHPHLGMVELGGWKPGVRLNPPIDEVGPIGQVQLQFLCELVHRLPRLSINAVKVEARGGGLFQVSASLVNEGTFPTALAQGVRNRKADPVRVSLDPGPNRLLAGPRHMQIDTLSGAGGHRALRWLILASSGSASARGPATVSLRAASPKAGSVVRTIPLSEAR